MYTFVLVLLISYLGNSSLMQRVVIHSFSLAYVMIHTYHTVERCFVSDLHFY